MKDRTTTGEASSSNGRRARGSDRRRRHPWLTDIRYVFSGRRRELRRLADRRTGASIVDRYPLSLLFLAVTTLILSAADAALTLVILDRGITTEANPAMQFLLDLGVPEFVGVKMLVTGVGVVLLVAYAKVKTVGGLTMQHLLGFVCGIYACLVGCELYVLNAYI